MQDTEKLRYSLTIPLIFVAILWLIKVGEIITGFQIGFLGVFPRAMTGLIGILLAPVIHADVSHLASNTVPVILLWAGTIFFYRQVAFRVFFLIYFISGAAVWLFARESYHIGASGLIYGFVCFIFFSGMIRRNAQLLALSLLVTFFYGGLVWGILPVRGSVSWEYHLYGALTGILCAFRYRHLGPGRKRYGWEFEKDDDRDIPDLEELEKSEK